MKKIVATVAAGIMIAQMPSGVLAEGENIGKLEYTASCAVCYGPEGKGGGSFSAFLDGAMPDLTQLSKNNDGKFPINRVYSVIDGREEIAAHGERFMTIWGSRYNAEMVGKLEVFGPTEQETADRLVRGRILELVFYLESIQE